MYAIYTFVQKINLQRHINEKRCKSQLINDNYYKLNELISVLKSKIPIEIFYSTQVTKSSRTKNTINKTTQTSINPYGYKKYTMPSGHVINYQGYENYAYDMLLNNNYINEYDIISDRHEVPKIKYYLNKEYNYYPDIYIKSKHLIIEVKSIWTYKINIVRNTIKALAVKKLGYNFEFWIYDKKLNRIIV